MKIIARFCTEPRYLRRYADSRNRDAIPYTDYIAEVDYGAPCDYSAFRRIAVRNAAAYSSARFARDTRLVIAGAAYPKSRSRLQPRGLSDYHLLSAPHKIYRASCLQAAPVPRLYECGGTRACSAN